MTMPTYNMFACNTPIIWFSYGTVGICTAIHIPSKHRNLVDSFFSMCTAWLTSLVSKVNIKIHIITTVFPTTSATNINRRSTVLSVYRPNYIYTQDSDPNRRQYSLVHRPWIWAPTQEQSWVHSPRYRATCPSSRPPVAAVTRHPSRSDSRCGLRTPTCGSPLHLCRSPLYRLILLFELSTEMSRTGNKIAAQDCDGNQQSEH